MDGVQSTYRLAFDDYFGVDHQISQIVPDNNAFIPDGVVFCVSTSNPALRSSRASEFS